jgi:hypothetical protein
VHQIPSTQQICNLLDPVSPAHLAPVFVDLVEALHQQGALAPYRGTDGRLLIALDGTEYHGSGSIHCPECSTRTLSNGKTPYPHGALTPVIVAPGQSAVFALPPEFIRPQDGLVKQDCELNAGTRWLQQGGPQIAAWGTTVLGDDLYCHQPFCKAVLAQGCAFVFVCLPSSPPLLYEWIADFERTGQIPTRVSTRWTGKQRLTDTYRWLNDLPLRDGKDALLVGWCELTTTNAEGKVLYHNAWASSEPVSAQNVVSLVAAGRSRGKIENENNNTLKTQGYHFEHNYGHGKQHRAALLASLTLLPIPCSTCSIHAIRPSAANFLRAVLSSNISGPWLNTCTSTLGPTCLTSCSRPSSQPPHPAYAGSSRSGSKFRTAVRTCSARIGPDGSSPLLAGPETSKAGWRCLTNLAAKSLR